MSAGAILLLIAQYSGIILPIAGSIQRLIEVVVGIVDRLQPEEGATLADITPQLTVEEEIAVHEAWAEAQAALAKVGIKLELITED